MDNCQITCVKPATSETFLCGFRVFQVAFHHDVATEHNLSHGFSVPRHWIHSVRIKDGNGFLQMVTHSLSSIQNSTLMQRFSFPFWMLCTDRGKTISFSEAVYMGNVNPDLVAALDDGSRWRSTCN